MNEKYLNYNIIPIGDHCAISMILKELGLRRKSYPFDWIMHTEGIHNTNIIQNVELIDLLKIKTIENIVKLFIDNAFDNENKTNSKNICFPHDTEEVCEIFTKYERRFNRILEDLNKNNIFILLTRHYYIDENTFNKIKQVLLRDNDNSIILFISGTNHIYFENKKDERVIFKFIHYDVSKFSDYDYYSFRPNVKEFLSKLLL